MRLWLACLMALTMVNEARADVAEGKTYRIVPDGNAHASLFVKNASKETQTPVVVWTETDVPAQQWSVIACGEGKMLLKNVYTGMYLDVINGALVQTGNGTGWFLEPVDEGNNDYCLLHDQYLGVTNTVDGEQPRLGLQMVWHFEEVEPQSVFDEKARQRMLDGFLAQYVQDKGNGYRTFNNGGWNEAETLEAVLDFYEATGDRKYLNIFEACYDYMRYHVGTRWDGGAAVGGYDWFGYDFNDDVMWMIIAAARAYLITGKMSYLNDAKRNFDLIWDRAYLGYVGLLRWAESSGDRNGANSCINGPAEVAACYIAIGTGDESYFEKARELYANQRKYLFEPYTGKVYDSVTFNPNDLSLKDRNTWASTYNQGTMLGGALLLYRHFGDEQYKTDASRIIAYAKSALCNSNGLVKVCQNARANRCSMGKADIKQAPAWGYCASQNMRYYGYKLHALCGISGVIHSYDMTAANVHDIRYLKNVKWEYHDCTILGDKGYLSASVQQDLFETANITLEVPYRLNQKNRKEPSIAYKRFRKRIETVFSQLNDHLMMIRNYAKQPEGFLARMAAKVAAFTMLQYFNLINQKPIGQVKYALF